MEDHIRLMDFSAGYGKRDVISNVYAEIRKPGINTILGRNGSGKTTLLRSLIKYTGRSSGKAMFGDVDIDDICVEDLPCYVSYSPAILNESMGFTAINIVSSARKGNGWVEKDDAMKALGLLNAAPLAYRNFSELSAGQMRIVLMARAVASESPTIMLDEPTSNLDVANKAAVIGIMKGLASRGFAILVATHDLEVAFASDWIIAMKDGKVIRSGKREDIISSASLSELYGTRINVLRRNGRAIAYAADL